MLPPGDIIEAAVDDLSEGLLIDALTDFLWEQGLVSEFAVWIEKWKENKRKDVKDAIVEQEAILSRRIHDLKRKEGKSPRIV